MRRLYTCLVALFFTTVCGSAFATEGDPVAIRRWNDGSTTIETHWNLTLRVLPTGLTQNEAASLPRNPANRIVSVDAMIDHALQRLPNSDAVQWQPISQRSKPSSDSRNEILVNSLGQSDDHARGLRILVDGVSIVISASAKMPPFEDNKPVDVLVVPKLLPKDSSSFSTLAKNVSPRWIIFDENSDANTIREIADALGADSPTQSNGNTVAVSMMKVRPAKSSFALLKTSPWTASQELEELFTAMEKSCEDSQAVFAKLSTGQMNFRPANGTHTPRWNTEHMMGRQLLFFSQIYHQRDPSIPVMDLNPKQMPPDYKAAHVNWDGSEEARQMQRVSAFTRRFAYLLQDVDLDQRAPGSRWTLRGLLKQMHRHYTEHTANTVKKFELPDWPNGQ